MPDELDTQTQETREQRLFERFPERLIEARARHPGLARHLATSDVDDHVLSTIDSREALSALPVLRKTALMQAQQNDPPFGGFADTASLAGSRLFMSPGPVWEPQLILDDPWQSVRALRAAGFRRGDIVHNAFSYHLTPGGFILDEGARALGCIVFPAGAGETDRQFDALRQSGATAYTGTPDYLNTLLERVCKPGTASDTPLGSLHRALVSGGALFPSMREAWKASGIEAFQCYATADLGVIAYEAAHDGELLSGMFVNEGLIVEIVEPGTGTAVAPGGVGEVVVTRLHPDFPLLRFATGDLSAWLDEPAEGGRTAPRIQGWMGRADQRTKVRGMFVDPEQVQAVKREHLQLERVRLVVDRDASQAGGRDVMSLLYVLHPHASGADVLGLSDTLQRLCSLSGTVERVESLPNDGIVIEDRRLYD